MAAPGPTLYQLAGFAPGGEGAPGTPYRCLEITSQPSVPIDPSDAASSRKHTTHHLMPTSMQESNISFVEIYEESAWTELLTSLPSSSAYMTWSWGQYKLRRGWTVHRIRVCDATAHAFLGCFQLQKKKLGVVTILLIQGGIHTQEPSDTKYHEILQSFLQANVTGKRLTVVIVDHQAGLSEGAQLG